MKSLFILLFLGVFITQNQAQEQCVQANKLDLYQQPNSESAVILQLPKGTAVQLIPFPENATWVYISINEQKGYVLKKQIAACAESINVNPDKKLDSKNVIVCGSSGSYAYHNKFCRALGHCKQPLKEITLAQAKEDFYTPCGVCYKKKTRKPRR